LDERLVGLRSDQVVHRLLCVQIAHSNPKVISVTPELPGGAPGDDRECDSHCDESCTPHAIFPDAERQSICYCDRSVVRRSLSDYIDSAGETAPRRPSWLTAGRGKGHHVPAAFHSLYEARENRLNRK